MAAVLYRLGNQVDVIRSAAGRSTTPEAERFAQQVGISRACARGCSSIILVSDCHPALDSLFDTCVWSGQIFSLDACRAIRPWLELDESHSISLWFVPSKLEWRAQKVAHDLAVSLRIGTGVWPCTSLDYLRQQLDVASESAWHRSFADSTY
jgi:hypothetical protein